MNCALYYPTIEFQETSTIKRSLLLWDNIARIVPSNYTPNDSDEIKAISEKNKIYNITLSEYEKHKAAQKFLNFYDAHKQANYPWPAGLDNRNFINISTGKIDEKLIPIFEQISKYVSTDEFLRVPSIFAESYMFFLAGSIASNRDLDLLSDSSDCWTVGTYFANHGNFIEELTPKKNFAQLSNLAIANLIPRDIENVPIDRLLRFLDDHKEEKALFQKELDRLKTEIEKCNTKQHRDYIIHDFIKNFEAAKNNYKDSLSFLSTLKKEFWISCSVGIATTITFLSSPLLDGSNNYSSPLMLSSGVFLGAIASLGTRNLMQKQKSVASYLVSSENISHNNMQILERKFNEFIND